MQPGRFINTYECIDCVNHHIEAISNHRLKAETYLIVTGKVRRRDWIESIQYWKSRGERVLLDPANEAVQYNFGLQKPVLLKFSLGKLTGFYRVDEREIPSAIRDL